MRAIFHNIRHFDGSYRAALDSGAVLEDALHQMHYEMGEQSNLSQKALRWYGYFAMHLWDRMVADRAARIYIEKYALPDLRRNPRDMELRKVLNEHYGLSNERIDAAIKDRHWSEADFRTAAARHSNRTQFTYSSLEGAPAFKVNPNDSKAAQFGEAFMSTFFLLGRTSFRNGVLLRDALMKGDARTRMRNFMVVAAAVELGDELLADVYSVLRGRPERIQELAHAEYYTPQNLLHRTMENLAFHGGIGMVRIAFEPLQYNISYLKAAAGPWWGQVADAAELLASWYKDKDTSYSDAWHKRWMQTWRFVTRITPPAQSLEKIIGGPPGENWKEKQRRLAKERKQREERIPPPPPASGGGEPLSF